MLDGGDCSPEAHLKQLPGLIEGQAAQRPLADRLTGGVNQVIQLAGAGE